MDIITDINPQSKIGRRTIKIIDISLLHKNLVQQSKYQPENRLAQKNIPCSHLKLRMAAKMYLGPALGLVEEGGVGHGHPRHVVVLAVHPHLLREGPDRRHRLPVHLQLL